MRLPRDLSGADLARALRVLGYRIARQAGNHLRLTTRDGGEHHVTVPRHDPLRVGTLASILADGAAHFGLIVPLHSGRGTVDQPRCGAKIGGDTDAWKARRGAEVQR
jgi:predicted RNA binding protein YcfA (HicA-like mRNA interferase family)